MTSIGVYSALAELFFTMLKSHSVESSATKYITSKLSEIYIRSSYFIFCMKAEEGSEPELIAIINTVIVIEHSELLCKSRQAMPIALLSDLIPVILS